MKILITTDWYAPAINGVVTSVLHLERELRSRGHAVKILTLSRNRKSDTVGDVTYIGSLPAGIIYPQARVKIPLRSRFITELVQWHPDIIHSQCEFSTFLFARHLARTLHIPIVHTYHTVYEDYTHYFSPMQKWGRKAIVRFSKWVADSCETMIVPTEKVRGLLESYDVSCPITVIPTGIDLQRFSVGVKSARISGISPQDFVCVYVGRLAKEKNIDELIAFHSEIRRPDVKLLLIGDGPRKEELTALARSYGISDRVIFTGMIPPQEIPTYYACGTVFVSASVSETQGLTYLEALASGLPLICRKDSCLDGVIQDGENGLQYTNKETYLSTIRTLADNPDTVRQMREKALQSSRRFDCASFGAAAEAVYEDAVLRNQRRIWEIHFDNTGRCNNAAQNLYAAD